MENPRKSLRGLVKSGAKLTAIKIDFSDPEVKQMFEAIRKEQKKCIERKNVDWSKLDSTYINI